MYYPVSALATLFTHILQHPKHESAQDDLRRLSEVVAFLSQLERNAIQGKASIRRMATMCKGFYEIAERAIRKAKHDDDARRGRAHSSSNLSGKVLSGNRALPSADSQRDRLTPRDGGDIPEDLTMSDQDLNDFSVFQYFGLTTPILHHMSSTEDFVASNGSHKASSGPDAAMSGFGGTSAAAVPEPQSLTLPEILLDVDDYAGLNHDQNADQMLVGLEEAVPQDLWQMPMSLELGEVGGMGKGWGLFDGMDFDANFISSDNILTDDMFVFQDRNHG